ncbi:MAG: DNA mismatch repair endonuclease MutL [Desulfobacteraceae bacterium]|nr:DNA mismatch repair endonuclease MutL [Desulfobacteraceae bacterium]MBC2755596.1 DNA mismatch repair endonuclease MutL [Desulfobacteraceae bacterium]
MSKIKILPEILSNKIAAGEVVERPASVVKELVENSIDAKSTKITIEIGQGGRSLIRISDNGIGMTHDDALLAIERYATSKIYVDDDLYAINTLGFRGEALPSIASVSKFSIITKDKSSVSGTRIDIEGGKIKKVSDAGAPDGTMISVHQLFFNTPARRKFLKTVTTEMGHIADVVSCCALACPNIQFRLIHNQKEIKNWPPVRSSIDRVVDVLGNDLKSALYSFDYNDNYLSLSGWTSDPAVTRGTSQKIYLFINGRLIRDRGIQYAIFEGYRGRIMKGRFPVAVLFIDLPPDQVDVNVHPTKHEVRFARQKQVYEAVKTGVLTIWKTRQRAQWADPKPLTTEIKETRPLSFDRPPANKPELHNFIVKKSKSGPAQKPSKAPVDPFSPGASSTTPQKNFSPAPPPEPDNPEPDNKVPETTPPQTTPKAKAPASRQVHLWEQKKFADATVIGQFNNTYILCEGDGELIVVDQHAAHERIAYERLKTARRSNTHPSSQKLMIPETFELGYRETAVIEQMLDDLNSLGLEIEHFGGNTFVVKSVPVLIADREIRPLILEIAEAMDAFGYSPGLEDALDQCIILMACHSAIRAHQSLSIKEMKELLVQLDQCENPFHCPHGRPTFVQWPVKTLEKSFKRTL